MGLGVGEDAFPTTLRSKRILLATESLGPVNGVSRTTTSLIEYLRSNGVDVAVVAPKFEQKEIKQPILSHVNVRLSGHALPYNPDLTIVHPFRYDRICARTFKPDLVYVASPASVGFQILLQVAQLQSPPAVVCNFQTDLSSYSQFLFPVKMAHYSEWLLGLVQSFLFGRQSVRTVFYPSSAIQDYLSSIGVVAEKLQRLGRGVDTSLFNPANRDIEYRNQIARNEEVVLVCVCRLAPEKGFRFLADVAEKLAEQSTAFKLLIVGGNRNAQIEKEVHQYFNKIKQHVVFTGFLTGKALARAYAVGDIFLHCSVTETFGLVILEAMASGLPVVARDQGGPSDIVQRGKSGYLIAPADVDGFATSTLDLVRDEPLRSRMAAAALEQARDTTWEKINLRVAWHLTDSIEANARRHAAESSKPIVYRLSAAIDAIINPPLELLRIQAAVAVVCFFWIIAVLPLIIHGRVSKLRRLESEGALAWITRVQKQLSK